MPNLAHYRLWGGLEAAHPAPVPRPRGPFMHPADEHWPIDTRHAACSCALCWSFHIAHAEARRLVRVHGRGTFQVLTKCWDCIVARKLKPVLCKNKLLPMPLLVCLLTKSCLMAEYSGFHFSNFWVGRWWFGAKPPDLTVKLKRTLVWCFL